MLVFAGLYYTIHCWGFLYMSFWLIEIVSKGIVMGVNELIF